LAESLNAVVALRIEISPWLMVLRVVPQGWQLPAFKPGQFTVLGLPGSAPRCSLAEAEDTPPDPNKLIRRAYSIASSSVTREYLEFYIALVSSGALTPRLFALRIGDPIWLSPKVTGMFTFDDVPDGVNIVLIATGTGLAPYMSMLSSHLICGSDRRFAVLHGARHSWDLGYRSELLNLQHLCRNFDYFPVISRPHEEPIPWNGATGYVQDLWQRGLIEQAWGFRPTPANTHIFLCGSPAMIDTTRQMLEQAGFGEHSRQNPGQIHIEHYW